MRPDDMFPPEMPDEQPERGFPLDDDTAERLLAGRLDPEDAPPGYAEVAGLLRAAAGPPSPDELAGQEVALARFRATRRGPTAAPAGRGRAPVRPGWSPWPWPEPWSPAECGRAGRGCG
jgi:hypothetical protein